jgi:hypothetical protein
MQSARAPFVLLLCVLVFFVAFLQTTHAQITTTCTQRYANFTTCSIRNGLAADGDAASMKRLVDDERLIRLDYEQDMKIYKSGDKAAECLKRFNEFRCINQPLKPGTTLMGISTNYYSAPCNKDSVGLRPCYEWCIDFRKYCYEPYKGEAWMVDSAYAFDCQITNAMPKGDNKCFGDNGILGMKSAAPALLASRFLVQLAFAAAVYSRGL